MTPRYLLDANILSAPLKPDRYVSTAERLEAERDEVATASVVIHEIRYGADLLPARSRRRQAILAFLEQKVAAIPILPYDLRAAVWHAAERARLQKIGCTPPFQDGQIAAIAAVNGLTLVTANRRDFDGFRGLRVETW